MIIYQKITIAALLSSTVGFANANLYEWELSGNWTPPGFGNPFTMMGDEVDDISITAAFNGDAMNLMDENLGLYDVVFDVNFAEGTTQEVNFAASGQIFIANNTGSAQVSWIIDDMDFIFNDIGFGAGEFSWIAGSPVLNGTGVGLVDVAQATADDIFGVPGNGLYEMDAGSGFIAFGIDGISSTLRQVPTPSSIALLSVSGLAATRRRRS